MENSKVRIELNGEFDAREMEEILRDLASARAGMLPEVPRTLDGAPMIDAVSLIENAPIFQFATTVDGGLRIHLRNSGLGWLAFNLTSEQRNGLMALLSNQIRDPTRSH
jgi:hypothetical protein